tara:strand:+ start:34 stop:459 length:426 start_codon:yes stop_codon:yes gene_type:complete
MSAFQCTQEHLGALTLAIIETRTPFNREDPRSVPWRNIFATLAVENVKSLASRYPSEDWDPIEPMREHVEDYPSLSPVAVIKLAHCYAYQACEHPGWEASEACKMIDSLVSRVSHDLPGYDDAPWGLDNPTHTVETIRVTG